MISKKILKEVANKFVDASIEKSDYAKKISECMNIMALETKKIVDLVIKMNDRLNIHEKVILQLVEIQSQKKENLEFDLPKKEKDNSSKPN